MECINRNYLTKCQLVATKFVVYFDTYGVEVFCNFCYANFVSFGYDSKSFMVLDDYPTDHEILIYKVLFG